MLSALPWRGSKYIPDRQSRKSSGLPESRHNWELIKGGFSMARKKTDPKKFKGVIKLDIRNSKADFAQPCLLVWES
jgi:hypothetical protein